MSTKYLYVFGNGNLSFHGFISSYSHHLWRAVNEGVHFLVCDFHGVDTMVMEYLKHLTPNVTVHHVGRRARYTPDRFRTKVSEWDFYGGFANDQQRDEAAIQRCTHFLAIDINTDENRKSGTQKNIERCLELLKIPWPEKHNHRPDPREYRAEVHWVVEEDVDNYYFAYSPDFGHSACSATEGTEVEALQSLRTNIDGMMRYYEETGRDLPEASYFDFDQGLIVKGKRPELKE